MKAFAILTSPNLVPVMTGKATVVVMVKVVLLDMGIEMRATTVCVLCTEWRHLILSFRYARKKIVKITMMVSMRM